MSTFEQSKGLYKQTHFTVIEIDLPVVEGVCTVSGEDGFGTPLSCDQPSNATRTYKFTGIDAPLLPESGILRLINKISETPAKLNSGKGLASRGTGSITLIDIDRKDPNTDAPAVTQEVINQGTFLGKLYARNELTNKPLRIKNYRVEEDGTIDLLNGAETRHYIIDSMNNNKGKSWNIKFKDELSKINIGDTVWPIPLEGFVRTDVDDVSITINVDPTVTYQVGDTLRSGDELMKVDSVANIGTGAASVTVQTRGTDIVYTNTLSKTVRADHSAGDELFVCEVSDNERIDDLLERILLDIGVDASFIPKAEWTIEIDEWHPTTRVNTLWIESLSTSDVLEMILTYFLIDMWFDPVDREIKISAISVWKESSVTLNEGNEIDYESVSIKRNENLRCTRSLVIYDKRFLATSDDVENYKKASLFKRTELESDDLFGEPKVKRFDFTSLLDKDAADLLVNRWVNRFINPFDYSFKTQERKLNFKTGDVVDTRTLSEVGFNGLPSTITRAQILSVKPNYTNFGRDYTINALSYEPIFADDSEIVITGNIFDVNLFIQYAGAPSQPVTITFIFDGTSGGGTSNNIPAIRSGAFPAGSKIIIIMVNGADLMGKGGNGGNGATIEFDQETNQWLNFLTPTNGADGGIVFDAEGIDVDIYFSGATPSAAYPIADGFIRAPSGGNGGFNGNTSTPKGGDSGGGGDGRSIGLSGTPGSVEGAIPGDDGDNGDNGTDNGFTGSFGQNGVNNDSLGGVAGSGIIDSGATVNLFGSNATRYINGNGDH